MANPQKENGYTAIANETMEALARLRIPGESRQVLDFILRKTYGWRKLEDKIALDQFVLGTGLRKSRVCNCLKKLVKMNLVTQKGNDTPYSYRFIKDFDTWKALPKKETITQLGNDSLPNMGTTKETYKTNNTNMGNKFYKKFFEDYKKITGENPPDKGNDRIKNLTQLYRKYPDNELVAKAIYRAWHLRKKDGFYYWRDKRLTIAKLAYRLVGEYQQELEKQDKQFKLQQMINKAKI